MCSVPEHDEALAAELWPAYEATPQPFSGNLAHAHADARVLGVMIQDELPIPALEAMPRLEAILTRSDGFDHLPLAWMRDGGVRGYHLEGYATDSVAHLALMHLIALARRVPEAVRQTASGRWDRSGLVGHHLAQRTVGIIGAGRIGGRLARILADLGVDVVAYDIEEKPDLKGVDGLRFAPDLTALLEDADAISLHVPLDASTHQMVGGDFLGRVQPGTLLVNTARGDIVDVHAVADALEEGTLGGFAADVLPDEPDVPDLALLKDHPRVLLTPHLGAHNHATIRRRYETTRQIADAVLERDEDGVAAYRVA